MATRQLAKVLLAHANDETGRVLHSQMQQVDIEGPWLDSGIRAIDAVRRSRPDLMVIGEVLADMAGTDLARRVRSDPATQHVPIVLAASDPKPHLLTLAQNLGVDDVLSLPVATEAVLRARLVPLVRVATMHGELMHRSRACREFGVVSEDNVSLPAQRFNDSFPVLVCADGHDLTLIGDALGETPQARVIGAPAEVDAVASRGFFDVVVMTIRDNIDQIAEVCSELRGNPRLFNLPVLLLSDQMQPEEVARCLGAGASRVVFRSDGTAQLSASIRFLARRQQLRWMLRGALANVMGPTVRDPATGLFNRDTLEVYLVRRIRAAMDDGKYLTLITVTIDLARDLETVFGLEANTELLRQVAGWLTNLIRVEDFAGRSDRLEFFIVLPDTPLFEAKFVISRILGVLQYTDFAVPDVYHAVAVAPRVGFAELQPDDTPDTLIFRSRTDLA